MKVDVAVVGAGVAGLSAAHAIQQAGRSVVVLEARTSPGGRIRTEYPWGRHTPVELGAEFVHDSLDARRLWPLSRFPRHRVSWDPYLYWFGGRRLRASGQGREVRLAFEGPDHWIPRVSSAYGSVMWALRHWPKQARAIAVADVEAEYAAGLSDLSMVNVLFEWAAWGTCDGDQRLRGQPYTSLIDRSIKALGTRVRCGERVATVIQGGGRGRSGEVLTETGRSYLARCAIVAVPLGVLKVRRPEFVPNLSTQKREAIRKLRMGDTVKVVVRLDAPLRRRYKYNYVCSDLSMPVWLQSVPSRGGSTLLVGWAGGPRARRLRTHSEDKIRDQARESLKKIAPQLPDVGDDNIRVINWSTEPDTLGSYSFVPPGAEGLRSVLASPEGKVLFAGEATHCRYPATVTGAAVSGQRAALEALGVVG